MRILVSGATGAIGRELVRQLLASTRHELVLVSRSPEKLAANCREHPDRVAAHAWSPRSLSAADAARWGRLDAAVHLAASLDYFGPEEELARDNVLLTEELCRLAAAQGARRFVFASSIEAVGPARAEDCPIAEDAALLPRSPYGRSKRDAESALARAAAALGVSAAAARIGNVYGRGAPSFAEELRSLVLGQGNETLRSLWSVVERHTLHPIHIDDAAAGLLALSEGNARGIFNLGGPAADSLGGLLSRTAAALGRPEPPRYGIPFLCRGRAVAHAALARRRRAADFFTYAMGEPGGRAHRRLDISRLARESGFYPRIGLAEGLSEALRRGRESAPAEPCA